MSVLAQSESVESYSIDWWAISPLLVVFIAAFVSVLFEAFLSRPKRWAAQVGLSMVTLVLAALMMVLYINEDLRVGLGLTEQVPMDPAFADAQHQVQPVTTFNGAIAVDDPTIFLWGTLLALALPSLLMIADRSVERGGAFVAQAALHGTQERTQPGATPGMQTEVFPLALFALGGMMAFLASNDLLTMFVALEVLSLPLYLMCGLARRRRLISQEAAVKYFLLGAFASAFFLYGIALLYGFAGSVQLSAIAQATAGTDRSETLLFAGLGLLVVGLMFKASVGPFHSWTPDVYQGAPTPITAFMAACTKVAAFGAILRVLTVAFEASSWEWEGVLWAVAIASMVIGAVLGLTQTDIKRMVAYSSIAHAGFLLVGAIALTDEGLAGTMFYLLAYGFTTVAVFGVITLVRDSDGEATHLSKWAGLAKRSPLVAGVFAFLLLALAGIPLTSGFMGKLAVFSAAVADGMAPLVVVAVIASAIAAFFYLRVIVLMYFSEPAPDGPTVSVPGAFTTAAITLGVVVTLLLGVLPTLALDWAGIGGFTS
ncbi:NADH-quinone oxidoreductase subunit N [Actinoalloteichus hymeniacidonis]|uniref:NADH-quinone oxidoreductase subunit NuoN n=1 Tax=Actinoalloteichus hymeniacidonis TaxID=340345 RepID=UPI0008529E07|nr:NADH-quinone oxidoreductase subunit NuoN [Actinoalloteichus hymeniacidonis]MBB5910623.1 NADH-quinone oxidoreductase subunit N [Actinoalloteichus hymeniacidonis]